MDRKFYTTRDIIAVHKGHFFDAGTMRFFKSRILTPAFEGKDEVYFVTSEKFVGSDGHGKPRHYTVRAYNPQTDDIRTVPPFNELSKYRALKVARELAETVGRG